MYNVIHITSFYVIYIYFCIYNRRVMNKKIKGTPLEEAKSKMYLGIIASLTLGLAPFFPAPHIFGKVKWLLGGAVGMQPMDWFDLVMHGAPWIFLIYASVTYFTMKNKDQKKY